jgi:hypothetical protein
VIKCIYPTEAAKLGSIAATYRSGNLSLYGTCPSYCPLLPLHLRSTGSKTIDYTYLDAELKSVPRKGISWSYTHFAPELLTHIDFHNTTQTILNLSTDTYENACKSAKAFLPTVFAAPHTDTQWPRRIDGIRFIRCPAELHKHITCQTCGGGTPLCARPARNYVIVFVAHGTGQKLLASRTGGCYASSGNTLLQWRNTLEKRGKTTWDETTDPERLIRWTAALPPGTLLRHRISGDIGI